MPRVTPGPDSHHTPDASGNLPTLIGCCTGTGKDQLGHSGLGVGDGSTDGPPETDVRGLIPTHTTRHDHARTLGWDPQAQARSTVLRQARHPCPGQSDQSGWEGQAPGGTERGGCLGWAMCLRAPATGLLSVAAPRAAGPCPLHKVAVWGELEAVCSLRDMASLASL